MRKITLYLALVVFLFSCNSAKEKPDAAKTETAAVEKAKAEPENTNLEIIHAVDKMTDTQYYTFDKDLLLKGTDKGMKIETFLSDKGEYKMLIVYTSNVGNCNENNKLIFLFDDDSKITLNSWNKFNCEGKAYFDLEHEALNKLQKKVKSIMFQNGRSYESLTVDLPAEKADYFIRAKAAIDSKKYVAGHLEDGSIIKG